MSSGPGMSRAYVFLHKLMALSFPHDAVRVKGMLVCALRGKWMPRVISA